MMNRKQVTLKTVKVYGIMGADGQVPMTETPEFPTACINTYANTASF